MSIVAQLISKFKFVIAIYITISFANHAEALEIIPMNGENKQNGHSLEISTTIKETKDQYVYLRGVGEANSVIELTTPYSGTAHIETNNAGKFAYRARLISGDNEFIFRQEVDEKFEISTLTIAYYPGPRSNHIDADTLFIEQNYIEPKIKSIDSIASNNMSLVSGIAEPESRIAIFVNDNIVRYIESDIEGKFTYEIPVKAGSSNEVYVHSYTQNSQSHASNSIVFEEEHDEKAGCINQNLSGTINQVFGVDNYSMTPACSPYYIDDLIVYEGESLTVSDGAEVVFGSNDVIQVYGPVLNGPRGELYIENAELYGIGGAHNGLIQVLQDALAQVDGATFTNMATAIHYWGGVGFVTNAEFNSNYNGLYIVESGITTISNTIFDDNGDGIEGSAIYLHGNDSIQNQDPFPIINNNQFTNNTKTIITAEYYSPITSRVYAKNNWWGTTNPLIIADSIIDWHDDPSSKPIVDITQWLDSPNGNPAFSGFALIGGYLQVNTDLYAGEHLLLGDLIVSNLKELEISPNAQLTVMGDYKIEVDGQLTMSGTQSDKATIKPYESGCTHSSFHRSDWQGVVINASGTASISHGEIWCAEKGVHFDGGDGSVDNTAFMNNMLGIEFTGQSSNIVAPGIIGNNIIRGSHIGLQINENSEPTISGNNIITQNEFGIFVEGNNIISEDPDPVITGNMIFNNGVGHDSHTYVVEYMGDQSAILDATDNWWGYTSSSRIEELIFHTLDGAGPPHAPPSSAEVDFNPYISDPTSLPELIIYDIEPKYSVFDPLDNQFSVDYSISKDASVKFEIFDDASGELVYDEESGFLDPGTYEFQWNGRDNMGNYTSSGLYYFVLTSISSDYYEYIYQEPPPYPDGSVSGSVELEYAPYANDFLHVELSNISDGNLFSLDILEFDNGPLIFPAVSDKYIDASSGYLYWNGRLSDNSIYQGSFWADVPVPKTLADNSIVVQGTTPVITGEYAAPNIEVKSDPYLITHSYEHISNISYILSLDSNVTVKLLPPGIYDPDHQDAISLVSNQFQEADDMGGQPIIHTVEWRGLIDNQTNDVLVSDAGPYTFTIEAESVETDIETLYRGVLNLRK